MTADDSTEVTVTPPGVAARANRLLYEILSRFASIGGGDEHYVQVDAELYREWRERAETLADAAARPDFGSAANGSAGDEVTVTRGMPDANLCFTTARSDLRYLIQEASRLDEVSSEAELADHHDAIEAAMVAIRDLVAPAVASFPARGGDVEAWVKRHRDRYDPTGGQFAQAQYGAIDYMLDDLRDRSDIGAVWLDVLDDTEGRPVVADTSPDPEGAEAQQLAPESETAQRGEQ